MSNIGVFTLPELKGDGFTLRPFAPADAASLQAALNNPAVTQRLTNIPQPYTIDHAYGWIAHAAAPITAKSNRVCFVIDIDGEVAGSVSFINVHFGQKNAQLSTWIAEPFWGKGLATKAVATLIDYGFGELNLHRIFAFYVEDNVKTKKMLQRLGFTIEGVHREEWEKEVDGVLQRFDSVHCSLLQREWKGGT